MPINENGFIHCPKCDRVTKVKVHKDTVLKNFPLFCTWCKKETIIDYDPEPRLNDAPFLAGYSTKDNIWYILLQEV